jgi:sirohydrochlorin ferrochelatase
MGIDQDPAPGLPGDEPGLPARDPGLPRRDPGLPKRDSGVPVRDSGQPAQEPTLPSREPPLPTRGSGLSAGENPLPSRGSGLPSRETALPTRGSGLPSRETPLPTRGSGLPARETPPSRGSGLPSRETPLPTRGSGLPARETPLPTRGSGLPSRGSALPMRTTRTRPPGRHRSPDRLSVPPDAPALVLAVPGAVTESSIEIAAGVIEVATQSCRGVTVRAGFVEGREESLSSVLADCQTPVGLPAAVVVPLLICPQPDVTAAIAATIAAAPVPVLQAEPLGVHPLLAGALHARLAEAGLARGDRIGRISIVTTTTAEGLLVAAHGEDAEAAAGTVAVLLAARLAVPVAAASFGDANSIRNAASRLMDAGVAGLALAPCVIGPEIGHLDLSAVADAIGMKTAQPLGAQTAIGQLAAVRYGAALQDPQLAGASG